MKALLIGGNGFIGSHIVDALQARDHDVRVLDAAPERHREPLLGVDYRLGTSGDPQELSDALTDIDMVFYLASTTVPSTSNMDPASDVTSNLVPLVETLRAMTESGVSHIVYFSSGGTVYGVSRSTPTPESHPLDPICSYGVVKVAAEKYVGMFGHLFGLSSLILRPSNPFGPRQGHEGAQGFIATVLMRLLREEPVEIWGDGSVVRDYLYVRDLAELAVLGAERRTEGVFNAGSGVGTSLLQVVDLVERTVGKRPEVRLKAGRSFDVPHLVLSSERIRKELGWSPRTSLETGVAEHWDWLGESAR